jgi:hypothetical protein
MGVYQLHWKTQNGSGQYVLGVVRSQDDGQMILLVLEKGVGCSFQEE